MATLALGLGSSLAGFLGELLGGKKKEESTGSQTTNQTTGSNTYLDQLIKNLTETQTSATSTTSPNLSTEAQGLINQATSKYSNMLNQTPTTVEQYATPLIQGINQNSNIQAKSANNIMAARGLSTSPVAATTEANIDAQRMQGINQTLSGAPAAVNKLNNENLSAVSSYLSSLPALSGSTTTSSGTGSTSETGSTTSNSQTRGQTTGTTNQTGNVTNTSGGVGDAFGGLGAILAYLYGQK